MTLTVSQAAAWCLLDARDILEAIKDDELLGHKVKGTWIVSEYELNVWWNYQMLQ